MKKLAFLFCVLLLVACGQNKSESSDTSTTAAPSPNVEAPFSINKDATVSHEYLRLYAIEAPDEHILKHNDLAGLKNLKEAININGFHITEKKPYGRFDDTDAVNSLTIQNKSQDTVYLMAGDVIKGGKQDRLIAQDMIVPPRTLTDISVFCVEPNRWSYEGNPDETSEQQAAQDKKIFAFTGYYNVASNEIRKTAKQTKDQKAVWAKVGEWTEANNAKSESGSYTNLEQSEDYTSKRNEYLKVFLNDFKNTNNTIGVIAVSGDKVLGADIFNHPDLFDKQLPGLLHSYITDAITKGSEINVTDGKIDRYLDRIKRNYKKELVGDKEAESKFRYNGKIVHFTQL